MPCSKCGGTGTVLYYHDAGDHFGAGSSPYSEWREKPCDCGAKIFISKHIVPTYTKLKWTNETWTIDWLDQDMVRIVGPHRQECYIAGGDFESMLSALCGVRDKP